MTSPGKICIVCGEDCSGKPRTKDLKGNYTCRACFDSAKARAEVARPRAAVAPAARAGAGAFEAAPDDNAVLAALLHGESAGGEACPSCGVVLPVGGEVCLHCGYSTARGKQMKTVAVRAPRERRASPATGALTALLASPMFIFFGLTTFFVGTFFLGMNSEPVMLLFLVAVLIASLVTLVYEVVAAFSDGDKGWGICAVCQIIPCLGVACSLAMLYYVFAVSGRGRLKALLGAVLIGGVLFGIVNAMNPDFLQGFD
jgi:hypothetical protein